MTNKNDSFDWDDPIDPNESETVLLPDGPAKFVVIELKRARRDCGKFGTQNVADLKLMVRSENGDESEIEDGLILCKAMKWKMVQFFTAIGQRNHGDKGEFAPNWAKVEGSTGDCIVGHRTFKRRDNTDGSANTISEYGPGKPKRLGKNSSDDDPGDVPF